MRSFEEIERDARPTPAFSNGSSWEYWEAAWCASCLRDAPYRNGIANTGCPLIAVAICSQKTPVEWLEQEQPQDYHCIEFRAPGGGGGEPRPKPEPPQEGLFPRPERATRMLTELGSHLREEVSA
ncbi:hypothetical protein NDR87_18845 [Nocardia sp. CDC159]|uniref:Uncharacterized protein n=1 Tax=Nocardia pulmonis TaxID=2951408 RepID=A0A9X2EDT5_9NOCA|nr:MULTISPECIES: hypothetical protein [Nocardia]MCM6776251.1 hypothetical protein [Nocardia pulmonis]MCM6788423.1 hypothetical protein [Nocardia sp. CDC159]